MSFYTIHRIELTDRFGDTSSYYLVKDEAVGQAVDEYETIEAAREAIRWMPPESASPSDCPHGGTCDVVGECPFRRICLSEAA